MVAAVDHEENLTSYYIMIDCQMHYVPKECIDCKSLYSRSEGCPLSELKDIYDIVTDAVTGYRQAMIDECTIPLVSMSDDEISEELGDLIDFFERTSP